MTEKTVHQKIIEFLEKMKEKLKEIAPEHYKEFFTEADKKDVLTWDEEEAKLVWDEIYYYAVNEKVMGFPIGINPLCIHYILCDICKYRERHGRCPEPDSTYSKIRQEAKGKTKEVLNEAFYKKIVEEIEGKDTIQIYCPHCGKKHTKMGDSWPWEIDCKCGHYLFIEDRREIDQEGATEIVLH